MSKNPEQNAFFDYIGKLICYMLQLPQLILVGILLLPSLYIFKFMDRRKVGPLNDNSKGFEKYTEISPWYSIESHAPSISQQNFNIGADMMYGHWPRNCYGNGTPPVTSIEIMKHITIETRDFLFFTWLATPCVLLTIIYIWEWFRLM